MWFGLLAAFVLSLWAFGRSLLRNGLLRAVLVYFGVSLLLYLIVLYGNFRYRAPLEPLMLLRHGPAVHLIKLRRSRLDADA